MFTWLMDRTFLKKIGVLAVPIAVQEILTTLLQFIDNIMVSYISTPEKTQTGENIAIAAVSFAGNNFFLFILLLVGISSGCAIFTAQYWGDKDHTNVRHAAGASLIGAVIAAILFAVPSFIFADKFIGFFTADAAVISMGASYLRIITISYLFTGITFSLGSSLRSITDVKIPILVSIVAVTINTILNYCLIFGKFGFPQLGVDGAAIATVIAKIIETVLLVFLMYVKKSPLATLKFSDYFTFPAGFIARITKTTLPVVGNEMGWALGIFAYNKVFATLGTDAATAFSIAERVAFMFMVGFIGTSSATATLMGNTIGANQISEAKENSKRILILVGIMAITAGTISVITAPIWPTYVFNVSTPKMQELITILIICTAITLPFKVINMHGVNGLMRSGGDTHFSMFTDIGCLWGIGIPIAIVSGVVLKLPVYAVYLLISIEEIVKSVIILNRIRSGKWIRRVIED